MVVGGRYFDRTMDDVWLLDVDKEVWSQVRVHVLCFISNDGARLCKLQALEYHFYQICAGDNHLMYMYVPDICTTIYMYVRIETCVHLILLGSQLTLPVPIMTRRDHSAVAFGCGPSFRVVVIFGGHKSNHVDDPQTETTLLFLGQLKLS